VRRIKESGLRPPNLLGILAVGLLRQGPALGRSGCPGAATPAVCKAASALEVRPEQSSILRDPDVHPKTWRIEEIR